MAGINNSNEPSTAPQADRWYNLTLGSSLKDPRHSSKFCTLRYEFKPASIDKNQRGTLHKSKDNKVNVEFQNNQPGKPKVTFEGISEDYKENDAVLFFDGESFRLERLHRAVKRLRHNRMKGESTAPVAASAGLSDASSPPVGKGVKHQSMYKDVIHAMPVEVERIDIGDFKNSGQHFKLSSEQSPASEEEQKQMAKLPYASGVGSVMYGMVCSRPDLSYAISVVSRFMANPGRKHWEEVKWTLQYLRGTTDLGLLFKKQDQDEK